MNTHKRRKGKVSSGRSLFAWVLLLVLMGAIAVADVGTTPVIVGGELLATQVDSESAVTHDSTENATIGQAVQTFHFEKDAPIRDVLNLMGLRYNKNIVKSQGVDGTLGFTNLFDVTFDEAMDAILGANFKYKQKGNLINVYTKTEYKKIMEDKDRMVTRTITLYYISAAEAVRLVSPVLSDVAVIQGSSPAETVLPTGQAISTGSGGGDSMALNDMIVIVDYPEHIAKAEDVLKELDARPLQVLVEATILSATLTEEIALGIDWSTLDGVTVDDLVSVGAGTENGLSATGFASAVATTISSGGIGIGVTSDHVAALIRAIESVTDTTVLANTKILAVNKQLGQVYIGNKIGYQSITSQIDTSTTQTVEFLETGTKLAFRPYIGADGYIRMDIQPKDSSGTLKTNGIPDEQSTELSTNVIVKDGQTIVIGGLFRDVVTTTRNQVPLLGDLPFLGAAFRSTNDKTERQEVIVILRPHIVKTPEEIDGAGRAADIERKRYGAYANRQILGRAVIAEGHYYKAAQYYTDGNDSAARYELDKALRLRPTYFEALRLKEKVVAQVSPGELSRMERIMLSIIEKEEAPQWRRW